MHDMNTTFTFRGLSSAAFHIVGAPTLGLLPERRLSTVEVPGRDGAYDFGVDSFAARPLHMECMLKASSPAVLTEELTAAAAWLAGEGWLILGRSPARRMYAKVMGEIDLQRLPRSGRFSVEFLLNQPWPEDVDEQAAELDGEPVDYGTQLPFAPIVTVAVTEAATSLQVTHLESGRFIRLQEMPGLPLVLEDGDDVVIDMSRGYVSRNGMSIMANVSPESIFFPIPPGAQTITLTTDGAMTAAMTYRRQYYYA